MEVEKLTPLIMQTVNDSRASPSDLVTVERLQTISREWASKVHVLSGALDKIVQPWSATASKLALAAASGDAEQLRKQVKHYCFITGIYHLCGSLNTEHLRRFKDPPKGQIFVREETDTKPRRIPQRGTAEIRFCDVTVTGQWSSPSGCWYSSEPRIEGRGS